MNIALMLSLSGIQAQSPKFILGSDKLKEYVGYFNELDSEDVKNYIPNASAFDWLSQNVSRFECPDSVLEQTYYYRWWTFRKHLVKTPEGFIFTEFITPVGHASKYNAISCALGHHIYEGRWLQDSQYMEQYISFWLFTEQNLSRSKFHSFSSWLDDAVYNFFLVHRDTSFLKKVLPLLDADYTRWEQERQNEDGTFWQNDVKDGMEESISGGRRVKNVRPTINSYMYANAVALSRMATVLKIDSLEKKYQRKATGLKDLTQQYLWNDSASFFEVRLENGNFSKAREEIGFIPWYFHLPDDKPEYAKAWDQLVDTTGFNAPWGVTTAERRHPQFRSHGVGTCEWDGAIWPFATTQTLKGLASLLTDYKNHGKMNADIYYKELHKYAASHQKNGKPYVGEYQDEKTGYWLKGDSKRSRFYNHSGFCDLIINDLVGLKPRGDNKLEIQPLIPGKWDWFCLDSVKYQGHFISFVWDKNGKRYGKGKGWRIFVDGRLVHKSKRVEEVVMEL